MAEPSLLRHVLGTDFDALPEPVKAVHDAGANLFMAGKSEIETRPGVIAWLVCAVMGLPKPGKDVPVTVEFQRSGRSETWKRRFGERAYKSSMFAKGAANSGQIVEHFGWFRLLFVLRATERGLIFELRESRFLGVVIPSFLSPKCVAEEKVESGRFVFDVPLDLPILGRVIRYEGWLVSV